MCWVITHGETISFDIAARVLKGDILAPFLFSVVLYYVLCHSLDNMHKKDLEIGPRRSRRHLTQHLMDRDFADDLLVITEAVADTESLLQSLENAATLVGLMKTEHITNSINPPEFKSLSGVCIKRVPTILQIPQSLHDGLFDSLDEPKLMY